LSELLSEQVREKIDHWVAKFPADQKQSAVLQALTIVQKNNGGWLTNELIEAVADYLDMPKIAAYEVVTFYSMFDQEPVGKHKIDVCRGISCMLRGSDDITKYIEKKLCIKKGQTTPDGRYTLREEECLAACINAPMMQIDDEEFHENLTPEKIDEIFAKLDAEDKK